MARTNTVLQAGPAALGATESYRRLIDNEGGIDTLAMTFKALDFITPTNHNIIRRSRSEIIDLPFFWLDWLHCSL